MIGLVVLLGASVAAGAFVGVLFFRHPALDPASPRSGRRAARAVAGRSDHGSRVVRVVLRRSSPAETTGLALTLAFAAIVVVFVLAFAVRASGPVVELDRAVSNWSGRTVRGGPYDAADLVTQLGSTVGVILTGVVVGAVETVRTRSRWIVPFLALAMIGQSVASNLVKAGVGRFRPAIDPVIGLGNDSFPSGHSAGAAATLAAAAFLVSRRRPPRAQSIITGVGVGLAVAVGVSRVLLTYHWPSDVVAGLMLGWGWFGVCAIAFGGRLLVFGAPVEAGERLAELDSPPPS